MPYTQIDQLVCDYQALSHRVEKLEQLAAEQETICPRDVVQLQTEKYVQAGGPPKGAVGVVVPSPPGYRLAVDFGEEYQGRLHNCRGALDLSQGYWVEATEPA